MASQFQVKQGNKILTTQTTMAGAIDFAHTADIFGYEIVEVEQPKGDQFAKALSELMNFKSDTVCLCGAPLLSSGLCSIEDCICNPKKTSQDELDEMKASFTEEERQEQIRWYRQWTVNGKHLITNAGGNFWMRGGNRRQCSIIKPEWLTLLVEHGVLRKVAGGYQFAKENA